MSTKNVALHNNWYLGVLPLSNFGHAMQPGLRILSAEGEAGRFSLYPLDGVERGSWTTALSARLCRQSQFFKPVKMMICRAKLALDHGCAFEIMADGKFLRDADTAMRLDCVLANKFG